MLVGHKMSTCSTNTNQLSPSYNTEFYSPSTIVEASSLNVPSGVAGNVIANLFQKAELHGVRERITKNRKSGMTLKEKLSACK